MIAIHSFEENNEKQTVTRIEPVLILLLEITHCARSIYRLVSYLLADN